MLGVLSRGEKRSQKNGLQGRKRSCEFPVRLVGHLVEVEDAWNTEGVPKR